MSEMNFDDFDDFDAHSLSMEVAIPLEDNYPNDIVHTTANFLEADVNVSLVDDDMFNIFYEANDELFDNLSLETSVALAIPVASLLVPTAQSILRTEAVLTNPSNHSNYMDLCLCSKETECHGIQVEDYNISDEDAAAICAQLSEEETENDCRKLEVEDAVAICAQLSEEETENNCRKLEVEDATTMYAQGYEEITNNADYRYDITDIDQNTSGEDISTAEKSSKLCYSALFCGHSNGLPVQRARSFVALSEEQSKANRAMAREKWLKKRENRMHHHHQGEELNKARKNATAKRERENGKFKRCKSTWVTLSDLQKPSSFDNLATSEL